MRASITRLGAWVVIATLACGPAIARAQARELPDRFDNEPDTVGMEPAVPQFDLSGPRVGVTFLPSGTARTLFGWHLEHQAGAGRQGPWFLVETIFFVSGIEHEGFVPSGTLVLGARLPNGYEFGIGPSFAGSGLGASSSVVLAAGRSYRFGGVRVPVNVALSMNGRGQRFSVSTGWAIRQSKTER